jgi:hypothetical protein
VIRGRCGSSLLVGRRLRAAFGFVEECVEKGLVHLTTDNTDFLRSIPQPGSVSLTRQSRFVRTRTRGEAEAEFEA